MQLTNEAGEVTRHGTAGELSPQEASPSHLTRSRSRSARSHLQGMLSRTVRILEAGIRPMCVRLCASYTCCSGLTHSFPPPSRLRCWPLCTRSYVFDGKAPELKAGELAKRCVPTAAARAGRA